MIAPRHDWEPHFAYFISPHGFGHAARAVAILEAFFEKVPRSHVTVFSTVPRFLFDALPEERLKFIPIHCDLGLVQTSPLEVDLKASQEALTEFWPPSEEQLRNLVNILRAQHCEWVICDIAPLGILAAQRAGMPSVLVENFTWDWIYQGIPDGETYLNPFITAFAGLFKQADHRIQTMPICQETSPSVQVDVVVRPLRQMRRTLRSALGFTERQHLVLVTMGGLGQNFALLESLRNATDLIFLIPGRSGREGNIIGLGQPNQFYHPDWVGVVDVVVGKLGYSTVAEVIQAGTPMAFVDRPGFPESAVLAAFLRQNVPVVELPGLENPAWLDSVAKHAQVKRAPARNCRGASQVVDFLTKTFSV